MYVYKDVSNYIFTYNANIGNFNGVQKDFYSIELFIQKLNSEPIQIIRTLNDNKALLETELKNILE